MSEATAVTAGIFGIGSILVFIIMAALYVGLSFLWYHISVSIIKKNPFLGLAVSLFAIVLFPIGIFVPILCFTKYAKISAKEAQAKYAMMSALAQAPTDEKVSEFMTIVDSEGGVIGNRPEIWNSFRNLWFAVNENPNVTTAKKREFLLWLSSKGLILSAKQSEIIDNYAK